MKLNLLPTYVGRGRRLGMSIVISVIMVLGSVGMALAMKTDSEKQLAKVKDQAASYEKAVQAAAAHAAKAEGVVQPATNFIRYTNLAIAMNEHNAKYPNFYDYLLYDQSIPKIPSFFRITSVTASPVDPQTVSVVMTGILKTHQQYVDLMLALLRIPTVQTVSRSPFSNPQPFTGPVTESDQIGQTIKPNQTPLPKDPLDRLDAMIARGAVTEGGDTDFAKLDQGERGPMPGYQLVTVTLTMQGSLQTPNPRATLGGAAGGGGATLLGRRGAGAGGGGGAVGGRGG